MRLGYQLVDGVFSEPFPSPDLARKAAERAARKQPSPETTTGISYQDKEDTHLPRRVRAANDQTRDRRRWLTPRRGPSQCVRYFELHDLSFIDTRAS